MTNKELVQRILEIVNKVDEPEADYYEDELWCCGNFDDVYGYGIEFGKSDLARRIENAIYKGTHERLD